LTTLHENTAQAEIRIGKALVNELIRNLAFQKQLQWPRPA